MAGLTSSTYEPGHRSFRQFKGAQILCTFLKDGDKGLEHDHSQARGYALDSFHPERSSPELLRDCTLYSSAEPCAMCAGAIYWAGVGRVVFGASERQLKAMTGDHPQNPTLDLPCTTVFAAGQRAVEVIGPLLADEALALHHGAWAREH